MTLLEAAQKGKYFRRSSWGNKNWYLWFSANGDLYTGEAPKNNGTTANMNNCFGKEGMFANDWVAFNPKEDTVIVDNQIVEQVKE